jgi:hypothetical protein
MNSAGYPILIILVAVVVTSCGQRENSPEPPKKSARAGTASASDIEAPYSAIVPADANRTVPGSNDSGGGVAAGGPQRSGASPAASLRAVRQRQRRNLLVATAHRARVAFVALRLSLGLEQVLFLSDILPTGHQAAVNGGVGKGSTVAIFGAGPVGLMAAASARMLGAERIFMVDHYPYRLDFAARTYGVEPINFDESEDPAAIIIDRTDFHGVDATVDAVGFEAEGSALETALTAIKIEGSSSKVLRQAIAAARRGGVVSVPGVYGGHIQGLVR